MKYFFIINEISLDKKIHSVYFKINTTDLHDGRTKMTSKKKEENFSSSITAPIRTGMNLQTNG
jgi:hypothetical protein